MSDELRRLSEDCDHPSYWATALLSEVCHLVTDGTHHSPPNSPEGDYLYITAKNIKAHGLDTTELTYVTEEVHKSIYTRCPVEYEDVLYIKDGVTTGLAAVNHLKEPFSLLSSVALLKPIRELLDPYYLKHWLNSPVTFSKMTAGMTGSAIRRLVLQKIRSTELPVPPLNEQKRIVAKIEELRDHSHRAKQALEAIPELCDRFRQSVLAAAFRGDLTADWREENPDVEPASVLLERICSQNPSRNTKLAISSADLPALPESWIWASVDELTATVTKGSSPKWQGFEYCDIGIPFVRSQNVGWGVLDLSEIAYLPEAFNKHEPRSIIQANDVLLNIVGASIGRAALATNNITGGNLNQAVAIIRLCNQEILAELLVFYLISPFAQKIIHLEKVDVARANFSLSDIKALPFPLIPLLEQKLILERVKTAFAQIDNLNSYATENLENLAFLNQSILAKAFRGELVEQDSTDEPASVLLDRIRAERQAQEGKKSGGARGKRKKASGDQLDLPMME